MDKKPSSPLLSWLAYVATVVVCSLQAAELTWFMEANRGIAIGVALCAFAWLVA